MLKKTKKQLNAEAAEKSSKTGGIPSCPSSSREALIISESSASTPPFSADVSAAVG